MCQRVVTLLASATLLLVPIVLPIPIAAQPRCLSYHPVQETLHGELTSRTLPGPPEYKSIARGDRPETIYFIALGEPICVTGDPRSAHNPRSHSGLTEIQLVVPSEFASDLLRERVRATGALLGAQTAAQRTPVVMTVKQLSAD